MCVAAEERKRILYVITDPVSLRFLRGQLSFLVQRGFEVHVATAGSPALDEFARTEGVTPHRVRLTRSPHPLRDALALVDLLRLIRRVRPDLVNVSTPKAGLLGGLAAWLSRVRVRVYVVRGLRFENTFGFERTILRIFEWISMHTATNVVFNSRSLRAAAEADGLIRSGRGVVLASGSGNGLAFARFESAPDRSSARSRIGLDADDPVLGFVGRYTRDKGIEDLLEAFSIISESIPGVRLVLAGSQDDSDPISADCLRRIADTELITDLGWIDDPIELLAAIDVLVFPSYREGLPNVPLEAQALGVPVVAYGATGTVDAVIDGETGILVSVGSIVGLADGVAELISDRSRMVEMGERGREWVRGEFAPERIWNELLLNYEFWID